MILVNIWWEWVILPPVWWNLQGDWNEWFEECLQETFSLLNLLASVHYQFTSPHFCWHVWLSEVGTNKSNIHGLQWICMRAISFLKQMCLILDCYLCFRESKWTRTNLICFLYYCQSSNIRQIPKLKCFSSHLAVVFAQSIEARTPEWRCSWSSANRQCSNQIWVINNFILVNIGSSNGKVKHLIPHGVATYYVKSLRLSDAYGHRQSYHHWFR